MTLSPRQSRLRAVILAAALYLVVGLTFAALANSAATDSVRRTWRLGAFLVSAMAFGIHTGYERLRLRNPSRTTALDAASAVALGAFGLAAAANIHSLREPHGHRGLLLLALVAWPILTGLPAFLVALVAAWAHGLLASRRSPSR